MALMCECDIDVLVSLKSLCGWLKCPWIECVGVLMCCESCMYLVCRVNVFSFNWVGVNRVEL